MAAPKFIQLLQGCKAEEWPRLKQFAESPFHNLNQDLSRLLDYLHSFWPDFPENTCSKLILFQQLFPGEEYQDKRLRYLFTDGCRLLEQFWTINAYQNQQDQQKLDYIDQLSQRGLNKFHDQELRKWEQQAKQTRRRKPQDYYTEYQLAANEEKHFERQRMRVFDDRIQEAAQALDRFYFFQQLTYACGMLEREIILQGEYQQSISPPWLQHLKEAQFFEDPQIELYHGILQMQRHPDQEGYFSELMDLLKRYQDQTSVEVLRSTYLAAINFCLRNLRKGKDNYVEPALQLYAEGLQNRVLFDKGFISPWTFNNTVKLALRLQRYDWIENFILEYEQFLPPSFHENVINYNRAELYYYTRRIDEALVILNQVSYSDLNYYLGARVILAKIYYETEEVEPLRSLLAAFTIFLKRNKKISNNIKQTYLNFCDLLFQITKNRKDQLQGLGRRIQETPLLTDRSWLLEQIKQLEGKGVK